MMNNPYVIDLLEKGNGQLFDAFPQLLSISNGDVFINKKPPLSGQVEYEQIDTFEAKSCRSDWVLKVGLVKQSDFSSREEFEEALEAEEQRNDLHLDPEAERLPIREAFDQLMVCMRIREGLCDEDKEEEQFNLEMIKIFGEDEGDEIVKNTQSIVCTLSKFRFISKDGNLYFATAARGIYYLFFVLIN